jgi:hypothetical protein
MTSTHGASRASAALANDAVAVAGPSSVVPRLPTPSTVPVSERLDWAPASQQPGGAGGAIGTPSSRERLAPLRQQPQPPSTASPRAAATAASHENESAGAELSSMSKEARSAEDGESPRRPAPAVATHGATITTHGRQPVAAPPPLGWRNTHRQRMARQGETLLREKRTLKAAGHNQFGNTTADAFVNSWRTQTAAADFLAYEARRWKDRVVPILMDAQGRPIALGADGQPLVATELDRWATQDYARGELTLMSNELGRRPGIGCSAMNAYRAPAACLLRRCLL